MATQREKERRLIEQRQLKEALNPLEEGFNASGLRLLLSNFVSLSRYAHEEEMQQLLRLTVRRIEWNPAGNYKVQFYYPRITSQKQSTCQVRRPVGRGYTLMCAMVARCVVV